MKSRSVFKAILRAPGNLLIERIARERERQRAIAVGELFSLTARALHD